MCGTVTREMKVLPGKQNCFRLRVLILRWATPENRFYFFGASLYWPKIIRFTRDWRIKHKFYMLVTKRKTILPNRLEYWWQQDWYPPSPIHGGRKHSGLLSEHGIWEQRWVILEFLTVRCKHAQLYPPLGIK